MAESSHAAPVYSFSSGNSNDSFNSNSLAKYHGLIRQNYLKVFRRDLLQLFGYVYSIAPPFAIVHNIMTVFRIIQFLMPALCPSFPNFWTIGSVEQVTMDVLSVVYYVLPTTSRINGSRILIYFYIAVQASVFIVTFVSMFYFKKYAKLPSFIPPFLAFYNATFGHYLHPIIIAISFEGLSYVITRTYPAQNSEVEFICLFIITFILMGLHIYIIILTSQTLVFRPNSLISATSTPQNLIFAATILVNAFLGMAGPLSRIPQLVFLVLTIIVYALSSFSVFITGGFIFNYQANMVLSSSITGFFFTILVFVCVYLGKPSELMFFFIFIIFFVLVTIINYFILRRLSLNNMRILDVIYENSTNFEIVKNPNHFLNLVVTGLDNAHPVIIELKFFSLAIEQWQSSQVIWYIFAKFVAIYPEETQTLSWIFHNITSLKLTGSAIRCIKEQTLSISRQREPNLSTELKTKLSIINKQVQSTKHKLRHVWDVVIQGNIGEVEASTKRALSAISQVDADFKHLVRQYPNNRFVTRTYSRFLFDIAADHIMSNQMIEKTRLLQRGIAVNSDQTHELGLSILKNLPDNIKSQRDNQQMMNIESPPSINQEQTDFDDEIRPDIDQILTLRHRIEELAIPSILGSKILRIMILFIFLVIPCIFGLIYFNTFLDTLQTPLEFLSSLAILHAYSFQILSFSVRYTLENASLYGSFNYSNDNPPAQFGYSWSTKEQLRYIISQTSDKIQEFGTFRKFEQGNSYIQQAQNLIFSNTVNYNYYTSPQNYSNTNLSIQSAIMDFAIQQNVLLSDEPITPAVMSSSTILNPINNGNNISININQALQYMIDYIDEKNSQTRFISYTLLVVIGIAEILAFFISLFVELRWIKTNKQETYQCLLALPKNTVSALAENLKILKKENPSENPSQNPNLEMNKQEENILKIFNSGGCSETQLSDVLLIIFGTILIFGLTIGCLVLFCLSVIIENRILKESAPHLVYLLGSYSMMLGALTCSHLVLLNFTEYAPPGWPIERSINRMNLRLNQSRDFYHLSSYGGAGDGQVPFKGFEEGVKLAQATINCSINESIPKDFSEVLSCYPADMAFILIEPVLTYSFLPFQEGITSSLDIYDPIYTAIWREMVSPLYNSFFYPIHLTIIPTITKQLNEEKNVTIPGISTMLVITIVFEAILFIQLMMIEQHIRSVLKLLLHCPPEIVLSTPKIMKIFSGDFSRQISDTMNRDSEFFDSVFVSLPDAIMYANSEMIIQAANLSCQRIFGDINLVGMSIKEFFTSRRFTGKTDILFSSANSNPVEPLIYRKDENTELHLEASSMYASGKFVMSCRDVTQAFRYNTLIREERAKSDQLLATILPPSLVKRVQEGEKNISFAVQSASILFSDIVEFTPWCGSLPAATVMSTLNILFKRFDAILASKPTMTKIKCIGDCYMAAGGIFAEINQPTEHAKEVVSFGIESIQAIIEINKEIGENLRIRVGVNTGGPIVAGVLGIGKPTFEILGPAINMAQQMEHHGVPMAVHISRAVYELIYGDTFTIRERGTVDVKGGSVITYLVTHKN
ncbi:Adenylate and Guanylate cyclase catalytic domain containing protein [Tritrichomonas foetus]|uniref:Adenylate and Guanylate cyclase catalytic domain containing protein n=1 Tax=Tritrichomonas foetus TaxID=1144522 RepID=A0A1J4JID0_9EUKA|nr:Adenylate and Guanylate cyclase catalytic domain containing protein [Tritrichomonas foetus]|eukprot:OHS98894.1 Adenylate and Guanylate cyclase catalytic domain containing protein [Tritrichomonas foetus]